MTIVATNFREVFLEHKIKQLEGTTEEFRIAATHTLTALLSRKDQIDWNWTLDEFYGLARLMELSGWKNGPTRQNHTPKTG